MSKPAQDRRIQRTRQLLLQSLVALVLEKGYERITVQDIIDRANVGRSTFYFHFRDKEDLLLSGFESLRELFDGFRSRILNKTSWEFGLVLFQHVQQQRLLYKALIGEQAGNIVFKHVQRYLTVLLSGHFRSIWLENGDSIPLDIFVQYMVGAFLGMLTWWLDNDLLYSAEQMNEFYRKVTEPTIVTLLGNA